MMNANPIATGMTSDLLTQMAESIAYQENFPQNMTGITVRVCDYTGAPSFRALGADHWGSLTEYRAVHDRLRRIIRNRGGRVDNVRLNVAEFKRFLKRTGMKDTSRVRALYADNYKRTSGGARAGRHVQP